MNPIVEHLGKALIAKAKGDDEAEGMHLEILVQLAEDLSTETIMRMQDQAVDLIYKGEIK
jgi:hypothetical protein